MSYDPSIGQWTTEDPIEFDAGDPNLRRYVGNDPTNETDPTGLQGRSELGEDRREIEQRRRSEILPNVDNVKTIIVPTPRGGNDIHYQTTSTTTINEDMAGVHVHVSINFNIIHESFQGIGSFRAIYDSPAWTVTQKQQVVQAVRDAAQKIEMSWTILSNPQLLDSFIQRSPFGIFANRLRDPGLVRKMMQYLVNAKQGLEYGGKINIVIDTRYKSATNSPLHTNATFPAGLQQLFVGPYFKPYEPIRVSPTIFFPSRADQRAIDMAHELGRYFGGITDLGSADDMEDFDTLLRLFSSEYNRLHPPAAGR